MIGKAKWFKKRKYTGRGIAPKTWEGWLYILSILIVFIVIQAIPWDNQLKGIITVLFVSIVVLDAIDLMRKIEPLRTQESTLA